MVPRLESNYILLWIVVMLLRTTLSYCLLSPEQHYSLFSRVSWRHILVVWDLWFQGCTEIMVPLPSLPTLRPMFPLNKGHLAVVRAN